MIAQAQAPTRDEARYRALTAMVAEEVVVYKSDNYAMFNLVPLNRPIIPGKITKMEEEIEDNNFLPSNPIIVAPNGDIMDGQHRFLAARNLGKVIYFIIDDRMTIMDVASQNRLTHNWKTADYLNHWARAGKESYIELEKLMQKYPIPLAAAMILGLGYKGNYNVYDTFRRGEYEIDSIEQAYSIVGLAYGMRERFPDWNKRQFLRAVRKLWIHPDFSVKQMIEQYERVPDSYFYQVYDSRSATLMLQSIYNFNKRNRVAFHID